MIPMETMLEAPPDDTAFGRHVPSDDDDDVEATRRFQLASSSSSGLAALKSWWHMNSFDQDGGDGDDQNDDY